MNALLKGLLLSCVLVTLTGCGGMAGTWQMDSIEPASAQAAFPMTALCLNKDHTFTACMKCGTKVAGTWAYDEQAQLLSFKNGKDRAYKARVQGNKLLVESTEEGTIWAAEMKRGKSCGGTCSANCCGVKSEPAKTGTPKKGPKEKN